jgi:hypothetical protein
LRDASQVVNVVVVWFAGLGKSWRGIVPPAPTSPADEIDEVSFREGVVINLQQAGAAPNGPVSFADLVRVFDHYLTSQRSVDLLAAFSISRGDPRGFLDNPLGRMAGNFRLTSIQCRTPSAASQWVASVRAAARGPD